MESSIKLCNYQTRELSVANMAKPKPFYIFLGLLTVCKSSRRFFSSPQYVAKRWNAENYLSRTVPFLVTFPNINHSYFFFSFVSVRQSRVWECIQNVTSIITVISKVIVVDAYNETERFHATTTTTAAVILTLHYVYSLQLKRKSEREREIEQFTAFFLWNKASDIFLLIIFICARSLYYYCPRLFHFTYDMQLMYWTHENIALYCIWKRFVAFVNEW